MRTVTAAPASTATIRRGRVASPVSVDLPPVVLVVPELPLAVVLFDELLPDAPAVVVVLPLAVVVVPPLLLALLLAAIVLSPERAAVLSAAPARNIAEYFESSA